jgi:hypothetical protein
LKYGNLRFFGEVVNEVLEIKNIYGERDTVLMGDFNGM